jgi:SOS-response transcriptional repressor LexA
MTLPMTRQQERFWRYLQSCERSPSYKEAAKALGLASTCGIARLAQALERKGYVRRQYASARSLVATEPSPDLSRIPTAELAAELSRRSAN